MDKKSWSASVRPVRMKIKFFLLLLIILPVLAQALPASLSKVLVLPFPDSTRVIFKMSAAHKYHVFMLPDPNRLVIDFEDTHIAADLTHLNFTNSPLLSARKGWPAPSTLRIVFNLANPVRFTQFVAAGNNEVQLVLDVYSRNSAALHMESEKTNPLPVFAESAQNDLLQLPGKTKLQKDLDSGKIKKKAKAQIVEVVKPRPLVVVVDAGHGGKDPGTIGINGTREKDVVLAIALQLADLINKDPKLKASLTRRGDYFVTLNGRLQMARKDKADLFIAIHADSYFDDHSVGASVYALSQHGASSMAARWLADRENHSELGGVDLNGLGDHSYLLRSVLIDLAETATIIDSVRLGTDMLKSLESVTSLHYSRVEQAPFMVLKSPDIPSILVETGFLSNPAEEERLRDPVYRDKLARALLAGIHQYVATHPMMASNSKPQSMDNMINSQV
jgi:N-acetylmuramoyl-L-alanine amidase